MFKQGLIVSSRKESLQHFKAPWAHEHEPIQELLDAVKVRWKFLLHMIDNTKISLIIIELICYQSQAIKPTVLIGTSGVGRTFTKEVIEAMASINEVPPSLFLSLLSLSVSLT